MGFAQPASTLAWVLALVAGCAAEVNTLEPEPSDGGSSQAGSTSSSGGGTSGSGGKASGGAGGGGDHCLADWRSSGACDTCSTQTQGDKKACANVLDCFIANDCGPATCAGNTDVCGANAIQQGSAPYPIAQQVYDCICQ